MIAPEVEPGDGIILCSAKPSWVDAGPDAPEAYDNLDYFERKIIEPAQAKLRVALTGDLHYYARFECDGKGREGEQKIIAGGGGAYLAPTYHLRPTLSLPPKESPQYNEDRVRTYHLAGDAGDDGVSRYPTAAESKRLRRASSPWASATDRASRSSSAPPMRSGPTPCSGRATGRGAGSTWPGDSSCPGVRRSC